MLVEPLPSSVVRHRLDAIVSGLAVPPSSIGLASPAYSWGDLLRLVPGMRFSFSNLWQEAFYRTDLFTQVPKLDVPVYFFLGRHDLTVTASAALAEQYFQHLDAPKGKHLIWFENSGHWPQLEEPEKFRAALIGQLHDSTPETRE